VDKVETLKLKKDILLPNYQLPAGFSDQDEYLKHLTYEGAIKRWLHQGERAQAEDGSDAAAANCQPPTADLGSSGGIDSLDQDQGAPGLRALHHQNDGLRRLLPHRAGLHQQGP
jgi:hypothetical protein